MPRNPVKCTGCGRYKHMDKGHKYIVSDTKYLCQSCYDKDRYAEDVCTLWLRVCLLCVALLTVT